MIGWCGALSPVAAQEGTLEWRIEHVAGMDPTEVKTFLERLQRHLASNDRPAVCGMVFYPLRVGGPRTRVTPEGFIQGIGTDVRTPDQCNRQFRAIFTSRVVKSVLSARFDTLFANYQGVVIAGHFGEGANVWLSRYCDVPCKRALIKVVTVNR
ncbi:MAG: hypothetical protein QM736_05445 [Vicinamibacterales bacterium]